MKYDQDELLKIALESTGDGIMVVSKDRKVLDANSNFKKMWQIPDEIFATGDDELILDSVSHQLVSPEKFVKKINELYESEEQHLDQFLFKDGRVFEIYSNPIYYEKKLAGRVWSSRDVTHIKQAERELSLRESRYKALVENLPQKIFLKDHNSVYLSCNSHFAKALSIGADIIAGKTDFDFFPKDLAEKYRKDDQRIMEAGKTEELEEKYSVNNEERWAHTIKVPLTDEQGNIFGLMGIFRDITDKKLYELNIQSLNEELEQRVEERTSELKEALEKILEKESELKLSEQALKSALELHNVASSVSEEDLIRIAIDEAEKLTQSAIGFFHFVNPDQETIALDTWSTRTHEQCAVGEKATHYPISEAGVWVDCIKEKKPVIHNDYKCLSTKKGLPQGHVELVRDMEVPIFEREKIVAIIGVGNKKSDYTDFDVSQLSLIAQSLWGIIKGSRAEEELKKSKDFLDSIIDNMPLGIQIFDDKGVSIRMNEKQREILGLPDITVGIGEFNVLTDPLTVEAGTADIYHQVYKSKRPHLRETVVSFQPETDSWGVENSNLLVNEHIFPILNDDGAVNSVAVVLQDMTELKRAEEDLRVFFEVALDMLCIANFEGYFLKLNPSWKKTLGWSEEELKEKPFIEYVHQEDKQTTIDASAALAAGNNLVDLENRYLCKDGTYKWLSWKSIALLDRGIIIAAAHDITNRRKAEDDLRYYAETQSVLLREVNHRVKNNLSAIISLLHIDEDRAKQKGETSYLTLLNDLISRIKGLAIVHSLLSNTEWRPLNISYLFNEIIKSSLQSLPSSKTIYRNISVTDIEINSTQAHHLTLIINELATNTAKYAMIGRDVGTIDVSIKKEEGDVLIIYKDDGPGFPEEVINERKNSTNIGFELIFGITAASLSGSVEIKNNNGAVTIIRFPSIIHFQ